MIYNSIDYKIIQILSIYKIDKLTFYKWKLYNPVFYDKIVTQCNNASLKITIARYKKFIASYKKCYH